MDSKSKFVDIANRFMDGGGVRALIEMDRCIKEIKEVYRKDEDVVLDFMGAIRELTRSVGSSGSMPVHVGFSNSEALEAAAEVFVKDGMNIVIHNDHQDHVVFKSATVTFSDSSRIKPARLNGAQ